MYFYLRGIIALQQEDSIVIDCQGVGYNVFVSHPQDYDLGSVMTVYTVFYVREDEWFLVGFKTFEEKELFGRLVSVKGVGPKTAIAALGATTPKELIEAIDSSNILFLKKLPAIGPKVASQIILDLRGKLTYSKTTRSGDKNMDEAMDALRSFGFKIAEINSAFAHIEERGLSTEEYIRKGLALLGKRTGASR